MCQPTSIVKTDRSAATTATASIAENSVNDKTANPTKEFDGQSNDGNTDRNNTDKNASTSILSLAQTTLDRGTLLSCTSLLLLITGMSLTFPHMQSQRDALGCDSLCYGAMTSVRGAVGLVGTALVGRLSDRNGTLLARTLGTWGKSASLTTVRGADTDGTPSGRRACLYLGTLASLAGFTIAASIKSLRGLWLTMIPGALLQHNFDVFKALLSEYHNDIEYIQTNIENDNAVDNSNGDINGTFSSSSRSGSVGKLGMAAGMSFMVGPMISAVATTTFQSATYLAIICTLASGAVIYQLPLPLASERTNSLAENVASGKAVGTSMIQKQGNNSDKSDPHNLSYINTTPNHDTEFTIANMVKLRTPKSRAAMTLLILRLNMALAFHIFNTIWPASLKTRFHFGPADHARFMSFIGVVYAFSQGFLAKRVIQIWGSKGRVHIIMACCAVLGVGRYIAYSTSSLLVMYSAFLFIINALGILNTVITADTGALAPSNELGGLFGALQASESAAGMIGPFLGGVISYYFGEKKTWSAPLMAVLGIYGFLFLFVFFGYERWVSCQTNRDGKQGSRTSDNKKFKKLM